MRIELQISAADATSVCEEMDWLAGLILPVVEASPYPDVSVRFTQAAMEKLGPEQLSQLAARRFDRDGYEVTILGEVE